MLNNDQINVWHAISKYGLKKDSLIFLLQTSSLPEYLPSLLFKNINQFKLRPKTLELLIRIYASPINPITHKIVKRMCKTMSKISLDSILLELSEKKLIQIIDDNIINPSPKMAIEYLLSEIKGIDLHD